MNKYVQGILIIFIYFGVFHDMFHPLIDGNIILFIVNASFPVAIIIFGLFFSIMFDKLGYSKEANDAMDKNNTHK
jgi:hypothetical protein